MPGDASNGFDDASTHLQAAVTDPQVSFVLIGVEGPAAGLRLELDPAAPTRYLLGQSEACDVRIEDRALSRRHASIEVEGRMLRLCDLGSTNGTFVDGVRIVAAYLRAGELVRMGQSAFRVEPAARRDRPPLSDATSFGGLIGASTAMRRLYPLCERLAASDVAVVIEGETGTGKEVLAEAIHDRSARAKAPFVVLDCTAVPPALIESELFGHERGAFTGAVSQRRGLLEQAHGGTLLIDEIGDLELSLQPKLLRALERSEVRRVGGEKVLRVDVRILAATRRNLDQEVAAGRFRDDLYHRLAVTRIELPPLRSRRGDVRVLAGHFCRHEGKDLTALPQDTLARWEDAEWPGNVRELRNAVTRTLALGDLAGFWGGTDEVPDDKRLDSFIRGVVERRLPLAAARQLVIDEFETQYIAAILDEHGGNVVQAAKASGVARRYFQILKARRGR